MTLRISQLILRIKNYTHKIMIEYQQFINWLKTKNLLDLYIDTFNRFQQKLENESKDFTLRAYWMGLVYGKSIEDVFNEYGRHVISSSFRWVETGKYAFWTKLDKEFQKLWNTNNSQIS